MRPPRECTRDGSGSRRVKPILLIVLVAAACARPASPPTPPTLRAPLDSLSFYVGKWQCKGTDFVTAAQPTWDARIEVEPELDGTSLFVQMIGPGDSRTAEHKGYDPTTKTWHHVAVANSGFWAAMVSPGWVGDHMVFTPAGGGDPSERATFTKHGEREYSHAVSRVTDHGEERVWEKVCRKS